MRRAPRPPNVFFLSCSGVPMFVILQFYTGLTRPYAISVPHAIKFSNGVIKRFFCVHAFEPELAYNTQIHVYPSL